MTEECGWTRIWWHWPRRTGWPPGTRTGTASARTSPPSPSSGCWACSASTRRTPSPPGGRDPRRAKPAAAARHRRGPAGRPRGRWPDPGTIVLEDGTTRRSPRYPRDLPLGWHRLAVGRSGRHAGRGARPSCPSRRETWGWMLQLYALHSARLVGHRRLRRPAPSSPAGRPAGAGLILLNPLHAITPTLPVPASPYSPSSRRFANPLYLRVGRHRRVPRRRPADAGTRSTRCGRRRPPTG